MPRFAGLLVAIGAVSPAQAWAQTKTLLPVVGFLAAVLTLSQLSPTTACSPRRATSSPAPAGGARSGCWAGCSRSPR